MPCGHFWKKNGGPLNSFCIFHGSLFYLLIILFADFYDYWDIKMDHSIFPLFGKKVFLHFVNIFISNIVGNIFLSSYISENKPWGNLQSRFRVKDVLKVSYFLFPKSGKHCVKVLNCIHLYLRSEILQHGYACTNSLVFEKKAFFLN